MTSVLHPVGPEPEQTYWVRRALVVAAAVLLVALVIALVLGGSRTGNAAAADPPPPVSVPAPVTPTPSTDLSPTPSASATPTGSPSPSVSASASPRASASARVSASPSPSPKVKAPAKVRPTACDPADLRATLTGKQELKQKQANTFALSLINGSGSTCIVNLDAKSFELKVYSGTDRIWSSNDCSTAVKAVRKTVKAEDAVQWSMRWDGLRSRADCQTRPEIPLPGTYFATAQLDGAKPVQLRMILRG